MTRKPLLSLLLSLCVVCPVLSQKNTDDDVVRITTNLVQIDAVVTKDGRYVRDLKAEDFEIFEDGRKQTISSFAYISNVTRTTSSLPPDPKVANSDQSVPAAPLKLDEPRRTVAIVVDDLGLSAESMSDVRRQLRKFISEQIQPHDLVAIVRTGSQIGALQQFTNDKRLLNRTVDRLRWHSCSRVGVHILPPTNSGTHIGINPSNSCGGQGYHSTLSALRLMIRALAELPGRKSLMVLSDSMPIQDQDSRFYTVPGPMSDAAARAQALNRIAEMAIRASVVIYSIDTQRLQPTGVTAADSFDGNAWDVTRQMNELEHERSRILFDRRAGGDLISRQTGGFQVKNSNDLKLDRVLEDQSGYYLIGYRPSAETFNRRFHKITAKVKRSGMTLRTRNGFFGYPEEANIRRPESKISRALRSPFGAQEIDVHLTSFFVNDATAGSAIRSFLYMDPKDLSFETINDKREAKIEVHGVAFGENGIPAAQFRTFGVVSLGEEEYKRALNNGVRIRFDMPAARFYGGYQVRAAARDIRSSRVGAAGEFVLIPNLNDKKLALSGIVLHGLSESAQTGAVQATFASAAAGRFVPNSDLYASVAIYNAQLDAVSQQPKLVIQSRLFRDGKHVFTFSDIQVDTANQADLNRIRVNLQFRLGADLEPGQYHLQLTVTDKASKNKRAPAVVQWADFEIVKPETIK